MKRTIEFASLVFCATLFACSDDEEKDAGSQDTGVDAGVVDSGGTDAVVHPDATPGQDAVVHPDATPGQDAVVHPDATVHPDAGPPDSGAAGNFCPAYPAATGNTVEVSQGDTANLQTTIEGLSAGDTLLFNDGNYLLDGLALWLRTDNVTLRSKSGNREAVTLDGNYATGSILNVTASNITIADLTITKSYYHPIHVSPSSGYSTTGTMIYNVHIIDPGEQAIKINTAANQTLFTDDGTVACSHIELRDTGRPHIRGGCYTGGVDAHQTRGWVIRDNLIEGFWCTGGLSEHGIHFWRGNRDTQIYRNVLHNNARGIGLGMGDDNEGRDYGDNPCGGSVAQDYDGVVLNNFVFADDSDLFNTNSGFDCGICLESACNATVLHNTVFSTQAPFSSIEYRFGTTSGVIANNLVSHNIRDRGQTTISLDSNVDGAASGWFENAGQGNLHLASGASSAIDQGSNAYLSQCGEDIDGDARDSQPDVGADER